MKIEIIGKGFEVSPAMKDATLKKLERIDGLSLVTQMQP